LASLPANIPYSNYINQAAEKYGVPPTLIAAVIKQESGYDKNAYSGAGAGGLMQLMPATARGLGVTNVYDPQQAIDGGTKYLAQQLKTFNGNISLALAAYNAGPNAVKKAGGNVPNIPETKGYVKSIMAMYGGGNIDPSSLNVASDSGGGSWDLGGSIVNGIQTIFKTLMTDTVKVLIYIILFGVFVFFGYQALKGSPAANTVIKTGKTAGGTTKKVIKTAIKVIPK
jgi:hypothetical protein